MKSMAPKAEMNFVPFIDVMLVLLIVFMVTSQTIKKETSIDVNLPKSMSEVSRTSDVKIADNVVLSIQDGTYYITSTYFQFVDKPQTDLESLGESVTAIVKERPNSKFFLRADGDSDYSDVTDVVGYLGASGVNDVNLVLAGN